MVKFEGHNMEQRKIMDKIQIFPSKPHVSYTKVSNQMPKLTKTIMSPLTTMPPKKIMVVPGNNRQSMPQNPPMAYQFSSKNSIVKVENQNVLKNESPNNIAVSTLVNKSQDDFKVENKFSAPSKTTTTTMNNSNAYMSGKILLGDVHPYITCTLCKGYLIKATTIVECLHTFCHSCLMKHLTREKQCPQCDMSINKSKTNIKYDATIQSIVYKLVPGLYQKELMRRRAFYKERPIEAKYATPEERGDDTEHLIFSPFDLISISLDYAEKEIFNGIEMKDKENIQNLSTPKFLNCPAVFKVEHLKKFIFNKFCINANKFSVEISYKVKTIVLPEHYTLMDVAYIYTWKKEAPMQFFYRIVKKTSKFAELPEVSLRRSPPTTISLSTTEDCKNKSPKAASGNEKVQTNKKINQNSFHHQPIKIKLSVSNKNVSIISNDGLSDFGKKKEKQKNGNYSAVVKETPKKEESKKDEYEFEDDIDQQKLGFLNTFQLTAKKVLEKTTNVETPKKPTFTPIPPKREAKELPKTNPKKIKFNDTKSIGNEKFLFTKSADGHEITFDMSPKPLGSKPSLKEVKNDLLKRATKIEPKELEKPPQKEILPQIKPKKLPMLLPKNPSQLFHPPPMTSFPNKPTEVKKDFPSKEISVTKINDPSQHRVYGPTKSPAKVFQPPNLPSPPVEMKKSEGFLQPLPPKPKSNALPMPAPMNILKPYGSPMKLPKNIPENMQTPYGCRTPFYVPSSPSYTPNFDTKPTFKYANPNAYASFMQSMFSPAAPEKITSPNTTPKINAPKRLAPNEFASPIPAKKKASSPGTETESKSMCILNKINFPSSLSVTLTNEQEENKKEQLRTCKQNAVNNNIEIIKISEEKDKKIAEPVVANPPSSPKTNNFNPLTIQTSKVMKEPKESFQRAFLESIISVGKNQQPENKKNETKTADNKSPKFPSEQTTLKKNISLTPPPTNSKQTNEKLNNKTKSLTPPPLTQDMFAANAALNLMLLNAAYPDLAQLQKNLMMETLRQNLALHQLQQQQKVQQQQQKTSAQDQPTPSNFTQQNSDTKS